MVTLEAFSKYAPISIWYAEKIGKPALPMEALQLVWPDESKRWPWETGFSFPKAQPLL
jgi:hypothetical protein